MKELLKLNGIFYFFLPLSINFSSLVFCFSKLRLTAVSQGWSSSLRRTQSGGLLFRECWLTAHSCPLHVSCVPGVGEGGDDTPACLVGDVMNVLFSFSLQFVRLKLCFSL